MDPAACSKYETGTHKRPHSPHQDLPNVELVKRPCPEIIKIQDGTAAITQFDEALETYSTKFQSDEEAFDFLVSNGILCRVESFLESLRRQRDQEQQLQNRIFWEDNEDLGHQKKVLGSIFKHLQVTDLKSVRQVCKLWCKIATPTLDAKTVFTDERYYAPWEIYEIGTEETSYGVSGRKLVKLASSWIWTTHCFHHIELDIEHQLWNYNFAEGTLRTLFESSAMATVETLKIYGYRVNLFDSIMSNNIPICLGNYWKKLKSATFLRPWPFYETPLDLHRLEEARARLRPSSEIASLESVHFEIDSGMEMDWSFLDKCPNLKAIEIDAPRGHSVFFQDEPNANSAFASLKSCLEVISPRIKVRTIEHLGFKFGLGEESEAVANFTRAVASRSSLISVKYSTSAATSSSLDFIKTAAVPLKSAELVISSLNSESDSSSTMEVLQALHDKGYLELDTFKLETSHLSITKQEETLLIKTADGVTWQVKKHSSGDPFGDINNIEDPSLTEIVQLFFPETEIYVSMVTESTATPPDPPPKKRKPMPLSAVKRLEKMENERIMRTKLQATVDVCEAVVEFKSKFGSEENAVSELVRMKDSVWPNVSLFISNCWASSLFDREDWRTNPIVLDAICKNLSISDLKQMRLVSHRWRELASPWLTKKSICTSKPDPYYCGAKNPCRGIEIEFFDHGALSHHLLDTTQTWNIRLRHLEVNTLALNYWGNLKFIDETLFNNPVTSALETLRICGFHPKAVGGKLLPQFSKYLKELKSLTLVHPNYPKRRQADRYEMDELSKSESKLEKLVVHICSDWIPSWRFLTNCPKLKCFKLNGRARDHYRFRRFYKSHAVVVPGNFAKCLRNAEPFLADKHIEKLGLKFCGAQNILAVASFITRMRLRGEKLLKQVSYEVDASESVVQTLLSPAFPLPSQQAKIVIDMTGDFRRPALPYPPTHFITYAFDRAVARGYLKLARFDFRISSRSLEHVSRDDSMHIPAVSLLVDKNSIVLRFEEERSAAKFKFQLPTVYQNFLSTWFPGMNYVCCPWQIVTGDGSRVTRLLEMMVPRGNVYDLPGIKNRNIGGVTQGIVPGNNGFTETKIYDARDIHRRAVHVKEALRSKDLHSENVSHAGRTVVFSKVKLEDFLKVRDKQEVDVERMDISQWNIPNNLAMVRTFTTLPEA